MVEDDRWWLHGHWRHCWYRTRWVRAGDDRDRYEGRVFCGPSVCVAVLRERRWAKVVYSECGLSANVRRLGELATKEAWMSFLRRAIPPSGGGEKGGQFPDEKWAKKWPAVYEYMTATQYPDGATRKASSLTLFCEDCQLKCAFSEKDAGLVLFATGKTLEGLLTALEGLLVSDDPPWRKSAGGMAPRPQKGNNRG